ncbi:MAG: hydrogenase nickel incorporation protein HypB [Deltaproteobacteria bacterium]|nr:hydrogenase nickel incorporation protein HypB [Deltaproteobacteria bacterium]
MSDEVRLIDVKEDIQADNARVAEQVRERMTAGKTFLLNLMSAPGSGKTRTILRTIEELRGGLRFGVMEADIDSKVDAELIAAHGISAVQLRTGGFCHLDASMVTQGLDALDLGSLDVVIIENVGNLVCPAEFDTGAVRNVMILSVPEGDDKPLKYPLMFSVSDVLLINKIDYLGLSDFDVAAARERARRLNPRIEIFEISAKTGEGVDAWAAWLGSQVRGFLDG